MLYKHGPYDLIGLPIAGSMVCEFRYALPWNVVQIVRDSELKIIKLNGGDARIFKMKL